LGLRAKTNLNAKNWQAAADDALAVSNLGDYALLPSVRELFDVANKGANEWIFVYMSVSDGVGTNSNIPWFALLGTYLNGGWGRLTIAEDFYNSFEMNDDRRSLIANGYQAGNQGMTDDKYNWYAVPGTPEYDNLAADATIELKDLGPDGIGTEKYAIGNDRFVYTAVSYYGVNYPILRYADILLTRAEALNELGSGDPLALVNEIRARSNATLLGAMGQAEMRDAILRERALEFFQEGQRRMDLIRSGKYVELWKANLETKYPGESFEYLDQKIYFPIPQKEIDANDLVGN
jgi:starch-binding outer membrane protein, SusD/RagB family